MEQIGAKRIDWIATVALGLLVDRQGNSSSSDNIKNKYGVLMLIAFWAPYLLLHLGGPDAIIAFALADNELWRDCTFLWMRKKKTREVEVEEIGFDIEMDNEFEMDSKMFVAVKRVSKSLKHRIKEYTSEVKTVSRLRHRNLVQLELLLAYEYMEIGSLDSHFFKAKSLLTWGTRYIKASNVMLDSNFNLKLGDFGLAKLVVHKKGLQTTMLAGNLGYMAPECGDWKGKQ
ncbi:L-type lectin-domain containing receptor kinase IX.1-like protein [Tanacetum coccineum]|uniref:L-type lectin-domain containing receptor kinase IX.1-like protein n=1 Tax=Tanacetum coccineum TaxID=301880 RepID=A0ABQ5B931_9ASTR